MTPEEFHYQLAGQLDSQPDWRLNHRVSAIIYDDRLFIRIYRPLQVRLQGLPE